MKKYDVLVVGELNVDLILNGIEGFPQIGKEVIARDMQLVMGSSSAIFASNLSVLGANVAFLGKIGQDIFGELVSNSLQNKGVHTAFMVQSDQLKTGATLVLNYGEDRAMATYPGAMESLSASDISSEILTQCHHLHISSIFLQARIHQKLLEILKLAKSLNLSTSIDPQWDPAEKWDLNLHELLPFVDVFLPNIQEFTALTARENLEEALDSVKDKVNTLAVKMGNKGSYGYKAGQDLQVDPFMNRQVVDAIGAGDSFNAGFIYQYLQKAELEACLRFGNLMGAINTTAVGGTSAFESMGAVKQLAKKRFNYVIK